MSFRISRINPFVSELTPADKAEVKQASAAEKLAKAKTSNPFETSQASSQVANPKKTAAYTQIPKLLPSSFIDKYVNSDVIFNAIKTNPNVTNLLVHNGMIPVVSDKNIGTHTKRHLFTTYMYAMDLARQINLDPESTNILAQSALVHDIGKALIPESIIQKPEGLTTEERNVVNLHSDLSAEILKTTDIDPRVISIVGKHHIAANETDNDIISQILSVADVYSALKEERPYKSAMSDSKVFELMEKMPKLSQQLVQHLKLARCKIAFPYNV